MDLATARPLIQDALARMNALYGQPVFDEWMVLSPGAKHGGVLVYIGPRVESFRASVAKDTEPLRALTEGRKLVPGDFEFAADAAGRHYDALLKLGQATFLVCNHTAKAMTDIRTDPRWLKAQKVFFDLSEKFRGDPLAIA